MVVYQRILALTFGVGFGGMAGGGSLRSNLHRLSICLEYHFARQSVPIFGWALCEWLSPFFHGADEHHVHR